MVIRLLTRVRFKEARFSWGLDGVYIYSATTAKTGISRDYTNAGFVKCYRNAKGQFTSLADYEVENGKHEPGAIANELNVGLTFMAQGLD